eukprot:TRINITY_DN4068_c0_g1_i4.p2 TRINITY_DN4068_c0_g1~~TRINITY_DN4068_c0_g1_i4.p2  ORF type:complete len:119 (+),score=5.49 TRINITY_DN4068_c0_g1_i4:278-634(+)
MNQAHLVMHSPTAGTLIGPETQYGQHSWQQGSGNLLHSSTIVAGGAYHLYYFLLLLLSTICYSDVNEDMYLFGGEKQRETPLLSQITPETNNAKTNTKFNIFKLNIFFCIFQYQVKKV